MALIICTGTWLSCDHDSKCCTVAKPSLIIAFGSVRKLAAEICCAKLGCELGCVGEGGGVAVALWRGLLPADKLLS